MPRARWIMAAAATAVAMPLAGCGGDDSSESGSKKSKAAQVHGPFVGTFADDVTASEAGDRERAGRYTLVLRSDGTYSMSNPVDGKATGSYKAGMGHDLTFGKDSGCTAGGFAGVGVYGWTTTADGQLKFKIARPESGGCTGRTLTLTLPKWQRQ
jgi:hypothetical protein